MLVLFLYSSQYIQKYNRDSKENRVDTCLYNRLLDRYSYSTSINPRLVNREYTTKDIFYQPYVNIIILSIVVLNDTGLDNELLDRISYSTG